MIEIRGIKYHIGEFVLNASLAIGDGEYCVLFGRTGCGKTTLLEIMCGLRKAQGGQIVIDGTDVSSMEPRRRGIGYVPQDGALFEHMNVRGNIEFAASVRGSARAERREMSGRIAREMRIDHLLDRDIAGLSGGERQRVALARALVGNPRLLVLDEPVSALDEYTRDAVCRELRRINRERGITVLHVCHSFEEARLVADRMAVMRSGRIEQTDMLDKLVANPRNRYVAEVLRLENIFSADCCVDTSGAIADIGGTIKLKMSAAVSGSCDIFIAPWNIEIGTKGSDAADNSIHGRLSEVSAIGGTVTVRLDGVLPLVAHVAKRDAAELTVGDEAVFMFDARAVHPIGEKE